MTIPQIVKDARTAMEKDVEHTKKEFSNIRSGKASPNMLDSVKVEMYGQQMAMNQCASVSAP
jgi:ribosome recycling factor